MISLKTFSLAFAAVMYLVSLAWGIYTALLGSFDAPAFASFLTMALAIHGFYYFAKYYELWRKEKEQPP